MYVPPPRPVQSFTLCLILFSPQKHCQDRIRAYRMNHSPISKPIRYGQQIGNQASLVLPLEEEFPILKRCQGNWGAKWALKKANSTIAVRKSSAERALRKKAEKEKQKAEAESQDFNMQDSEWTHSFKDEIDDSDVVGAGAVKVVDKVNIEKITLPGISFVDMYHHPVEVCVENPGVDAGYQACMALFNESKTWLAAGTARYNWE